jgi:uncharacterized protein
LSLLSIDELNEQLESAGVGHGAFEVHGAIVGALCANANRALEDWFSDWLEEGFAVDGDSDVGEQIEALAQRTRQALEDSGLEFSLPMPFDDAPIVERADALRDWCGGFIGGIGDSPAGVAEPDVLEILTDFERIARTQFHGDENDEDAENDLFELVEYVRVSAQLVFEIRSTPPREPLQ